MSIAKAIQIVLLIGMVALFPMIVSAQSGPTEAPPRPPITAPEMPDGRGFIPPAINLDHLAPKKTPPSMALSLPAAWDWRTQGMVTAVRNQGACGSCYSFASTANFEAKILVDGGSVFNFSENNIKECNFWQTSCDGGNFHQVADWLSKAGTVLESCDPYVAADVACLGSCDYQKTLLDWRIISGESIPATADLKQYIYDNGPVYTTFYAGGVDDPGWTSELNNYDGSYTLYSTDDYVTNHAVLIVGWDDTLTHAGGSGGWIVKNSWGTSWGGTCGYGTESGYFTIAYGSANIGQWSSFIKEYQDYAGTGDLYYLDDGGWTTSYGYSNTTGYGLCEFILASDQYITRVEFWTNDVTTDVDIWLYDDFNGSTLSNLLASKLDTSFSEAGYHSVALPSPPQVASGETVYAMVKFTNTIDNFPVICDYTAPVAAGSSWLSYSGASGSWTDMATIQVPCEVAIRIRTSPTLALGVGDIELPLPDDFELGYNYPNPFNPATTISYSLEEKAAVQVIVYNVLGQKVRTLVDSEQTVGEHEIVWDGRADNDAEAGTGIYFYRIQVGEQSQVKKMLLLR
ncbi:MAG: C1 family peptidase [bacterium]